jgi:hypothetical protein
LRPVIVTYWSELVLIAQAYRIQRSSLPSATALIALSLVGMSASCSQGGWACILPGPVDALANEVRAGIERAALLETMPCVIDRALTERSRANGVGWIHEALMARTAEITLTVQTRPSAPTASTIRMGAFNPKAMPASWRGRCVPALISPLPALRAAPQRARRADQRG